MRETADGLIGKLAEKLNLPDLALDEQGYCCVSFDDIVVNVEHEDASEELLLFAKVQDAPGDLSQRYVEELFDLSYAAMLTGGGCLGLDRAGGVVMFADRLCLRGLDDAAFEKELESFVDRAEGWRNLLGGAEFARATADGPNLTEVGSMMRI